MGQLAELTGLPRNAVKLVGETTLAHLSTRPDYAVSVRNALAGFIEVKAPGKGFDPRRFTDDDDKKQWQKLKTLPNLIYTDGNGFTLWQDGQLKETVELDGDIEKAGAKLTAPATLLALFANFFAWNPIVPEVPSSLPVSRRASAACGLVFLGSEMGAVLTRLKKGRRGCDYAPGAV